MKNYLKLAGLLCLGSMLYSCGHPELLAVHSSAEDLCFTQLASSWDEGIPLGNAEVGALVWQKKEALRMSLDRTDLWDLRPMDSLSGSNYRFSWVKEHIRKKDYLPVQRKFDHPYDLLPAPAKIPGAALEFPIQQLGKPQSVRLYLNNALCEVRWNTGAVMQTFVHANKPLGWFVFKNVGEDFEPQLVAPQYKVAASQAKSNSHAGPSLQRLGYEQGVIERQGNSLVYHQKGYGDYYYEVAVEWKHVGKDVYGAWSVTSSLSADKADNETQEAMDRGMTEDYSDHLTFWNSYWSASSVSIPDSILQKQYRNEMYKFGSATRENSSPISLQSVWTADNGLLPPWKGDYHHDLNTQLSYWPTYVGNHLTEGMGYLNTLWNQRDVYKQYTRQYFETDGMNVPGVATLKGEPMGGWIQYAMSQTVGAWLAHHFYLHWKYSADRDFLKNRAYPFIKDVAICLEQLSQVDKDGVRTLEYSSSPEIFDNSIHAWFKHMTNYDLSLMKSLFTSAAELADELKLTDEARHWEEVAHQLPDFDLDNEGALTFSKGFPYNASHRHFSHAMAIHPLGLIDWNDGEKSQQIIRATLKKLEDYGPQWWCGYSYSWMGNMYARAFEGEKAAQTLKVFAECFCLPNTFHANGDQSKSGKSGFTYRPFTLEGNFAFAAGIHEMLLQSHTGVIRVFPAIPDSWTDVSFTNLRAMGAFLVSATKSNGKLVRLTLRSEKGGTATLLNPVTGKIERYEMAPGEVIECCSPSQNR